MSPRPASGAPRPLSPLLAVAPFVTVEHGGPARAVGARHARRATSSRPPRPVPSHCAAPRSCPSAAPRSSPWATDHARLADDPQHRRRHGHLAVAASAAPKGARHHPPSFVWDCGGGISRYEVVVQRDLNALSARLKHLFPGEEITRGEHGKDGPVRP